MAWALGWVNGHFRFKFTQIVYITQQLCLHSSSFNFLLSLTFKLLQTWLGASFLHTLHCGNSFENLHNSNTILKIGEIFFIFYFYFLLKGLLEWFNVFPFKDFYHH